MIEAVLASYGQLFPDELPEQHVLREQVARGDVMNDRATLPGHITGSAIVLSPDRQKILVVHHVFLDMWLQPGGHWDPGEATPLAAAQREGVEETGVEIVGYIPIRADEPLLPLDIETHAIPANPRKSEPAHYHHDLRYVFIAASEQLARDAGEVSEAVWVSFDDKRTEHLGRVIPKLRQHILTGVVPEVANK